MITFDDTNRLLYVSLKHQDNYANSKTESIDKSLYSGSSKMDQ